MPTFFRDLFGNIRAVGLCIDIIGAFFLAKSFVVKSYKDIAADAWGTKYRDLPGDMGGNLSVSFGKQRIEARVGFAGLACGFVLQAVGSVRNTGLSPTIGFLVVILILVVSWIAASYFGRTSRVLLKAEGADRELSEVGKAGE